MHLAADRPAVGARGTVGRQQAGLGLQLGQILGNPERVPDFDAVMYQARHQERGGEQQQLCASGGIIDRHHLLLELEAGHPAQQPAAHRP
jgi:hypothetical protein